MSHQKNKSRPEQARADQSRPEQIGADQSRPEQTGQGYKVSKLGFGKTRFVWVRSPSNLGSPATAHLEPICLLPTLPPKTCGQASALPELTTLQEPPKPRSARLLPDLRVDLTNRPTCMHTRAHICMYVCFLFFVSKDLARWVHWQMKCQAILMASKSVLWHFEPSTVAIL